MKLKILNGMSKNTVITIDKFPSKWGRDENCDYQLHDTPISREHFIIKRKEEDIYVEDLRSTNGIMLNGRETHGEFRIEKNDYLVIGGEVEILVLETQKETFFSYKKSMASKKLAERKINKLAKTAKIDAKILSLLDVKTVKINKPTQTTSANPLTKTDSLSTKDKSIQTGTLPKTDKLSKTGKSPKTITRKFCVSSSGILRQQINIEDTIFMADKRDAYNNHQILKTIYKVMHICNKETNVEGLLEKLLISIIEVIDADRGAIILKTKDNSHKGKAFLTRSKKKKPFSVSQTILQDIIANKVSIISFKPTEDKPYRESDSLRYAHVQSFICAPLLSGECSLGAIYFDRTNIQSDSFEISSMELITAIGIQIGSVLEKSLILEKWCAANRSLEEAQDYMFQQERLRALGEMASGIVHDFNNSLSPITGYTEMLLTYSNYLDDKAKLTKYIKAIHTCAMDAANTVARLREFYRHRDHCEVFIAIDLNMLVEQTRSLTKPRWEGELQKKGIQVKFEIKLGEIPFISGIESELREMLTNLIFNSVDAMPEGGVIEISTYLEEGQIVLAISDTGIGMSEEVCQRCMEPFYSSKGKQGSGLGLAMVFGIVQRHAGILSVISSPGKGSTFFIRFPIQNGLSESPKLSSTKPEQSLKILAIDDDPKVLSSLVDCLISEGHSTKQAANGHEGLQKFHKEYFDLVITDLAMPKMNGREVADAIKKINPEIPILLLTGFGNTWGEENIPESVNGVLSKPFTISKLRNILPELITKI